MRKRFMHDSLMKKSKKDSEKKLKKVGKGRNKKQKNSLSKERKVKYAKRVYKSRKFNAKFTTDIECRSVSI